MGRVVMCFCTDMGLIIQIKMDRLREFDPADVECRQDPSARGYRIDSRVFSSGVQVSLIRFAKMPCECMK
jgi:hypothetical protein